MESILKDIRFAARTLMKQPGYTIVALITLTLGIGANTAIFSVVNGVLLRPLPFTDPERVVMVWNNGVAAAGGDRTPLAVADFNDLRDQNHSFESVGAIQYGIFNLTGGRTPEQVRGVNVTSNLLSLLGVGVQVGRGFEANDSQVGSSGVVLLSDGFWRSHFGADPNVVGRVITLSGESVTIIGVMPASFAFPSSNIQLWRALQLQPPTRRGPYFLTGVGRLKPGVPIEQARADALSMKSTFEKQGFDLNVLTVKDFLFGEVRPTLIALLVAVTLVLLIAAVNVANLTLVRAASQVRELAIRAALGASRGRIVRRLLSESVLLALVGGTLGSFVAWWGVSLLMQAAPAGLPRLDQIQIDVRVLIWTGLVSLLTALVFGLAPALQNSKLNLTETLKDGGRTSETASRRLGRDILVVVELALAVMLLTGAGLLVKSLWRLQHVDLGIQPEGVLTMQVGLTDDRYNEARARDFSRQLVERTKSLPGVRAAALSNSLPPDETEFSSDFYVEGQSQGSATQEQVAYFHRVSSDYFQALGIALRSGRLFTNSDTEHAPQVILINETLKRRFFGAVDPVGKRINLNPREPDWTEIVGVVADVKYFGIADEVQPSIYQPIEQHPTPSISIILKTDVSDPLKLTAATRQQVSQLDPDLPVTNVNTMDQRLSTASAQPRFRTTLIGLFAAVALALACVGIYGVISYSVSQRTHEIGIRMALGARRENVLAMVIRHAVLLAGIGVAMGLIASLGLTRFIGGLLFGVKATDPLTYAATALVLSSTALLASYIPARRAAKVDPMEALRYE
jgi:putative ABC transport system permease protein